MVDNSDSTQSPIPPNAIYTDIPEIEQRLLTAIPQVLNAGYLLEDHYTLPYGVRLMFRKEAISIGVNVYYSKKNGHTTVFDKNIAPKTENTLRRLLNPIDDLTAISPFERERSFTKWIGCDEGGKGAFTGPLVTAAYFCDRDHAAELIDIGVLDSKRLEQQTLRKLAATLKKFTGRFTVLELKPETYNRLWEDFRRQNRTLNDLLAWAHGKTVEKLLTKQPEAVIVDQFARADLIRSRMPRNVPEMIVRPKAENNIAVAAASIIAANRYLEAIDRLSKEFGVVIRPGAGANADESVKEAVAKHGPEVLDRLVKRHFKNVLKIG